MQQPSVDPGWFLIVPLTSHYPPPLCLQACPAHTRQFPFPTGETSQAGRRRLLVAFGQCLGAGGRYVQGMLCRTCLSPLRCARAVDVLAPAVLCLNPQECSLNAGELGLQGVSHSTLLKILQQPPSWLSTAQISIRVRKSWGGGRKCRNYTVLTRKTGQEQDVKGFPSTAGEKLSESSPKGEAGILTYGKGCAPSVPLSLIHEVPPDGGKSRAVSAAGLGLGCGDGVGPAEGDEVPECSPWDHRAGQLLLSR